MKIIKERVKKYWELPGINQSLIVQLSKNYVKKSLETKATTLGSAYDCLLMYPEEWKTHFIEIEGSPGEKFKKAFDYVLWQLTQDSKVSDILVIDDVKDYLLNSAKIYAIGGTGKNSWSDERKIVEFKKRAYYWVAMWKAHSNDLKIIYKDEKVQAERMAQVTREHRFTKEIMEYKDCKIQFPIEFEIGGLPCKCLIDRILRNNTDKAIYIGPILMNPMSMRVADHKKTGFVAEDLPKSVRDYRYDIQGEFYSEGLRQKFSPRYEIMNPIIIAQPDNLVHPIVYELSDKDRDIARSGKIINGKTRVKGLTQMIVEYKERIDDQQWKYGTEVWKNQGLLKTDLWHFYN